MFQPARVLWKQSFKCIRVSIVSSELNCLDACAQFSQSASYTSRTLLQGVLPCQAAVCQPDKESRFIAAVLAGHQCRCRSAQVGSVQAVPCKVWQSHDSQPEQLHTASGGC